MPELTVASTTDTEAEVKLAANVPIVPEPEEEQPEQPEQQPADEHETKPAKNSFQKRIDRLTRDKSEAERKAQALEDRVRELEGTQIKPEVQAEPQRQSSRTKPKYDDTDAQGKAKYATYEDFIEDLADWKVEQKEYAKQEQETKKAQEEQRTKTIGQYNRQMNEFKKNHADWDAVVGQELIVPQVALDTVIELGNPGIAYYLGQHPEVCDELSNHWDKNRNPRWIAARIGQIDTQTSVAPSIDAEEEEPEPVPVRRSSAPPPIKPVGGSSTKSSVPLDEMPYSEYRKLRDRQQKERYRR